MDSQAAVEQIRDVCKNIGLQLMRLHPAVRALSNRETQDELFKAIFEITSKVEAIKKKVATKEAGGDPPLV